MTTTQNNRPILDLKRWEFVGITPVATVAGALVASSRHHKQQQLYLTSLTGAHLYHPGEDGFVALPSPTLPGTFSAGATATAVAWSTGNTLGVSQLTATGGTTSTIVTNQPLARDLRGYSIHITGGPNAGATLVIASNTIGTNAVITVPIQGVAFTASTTYRLMTPRWFVGAAGTLAALSFRCYDYATNTWLTPAVLPATIGTDAKLVCTPSWLGSGYKAFATGTATAGSATTLTNGAKNWAVNQWANYQLRIVSGTGAGQIRPITSNTATVITIPTGATLDATSQYSIEGNDDVIYLMGNNAVTLYRYTCSTNLWATVSPGLARSGAPGAGMSGHWVYDSQDSAVWDNENNIISGRRIYSWRGGGSAALDYFDIPGQTWVAQTYSPATDTLTTGTKHSYAYGYFYILLGGSNRWLRYNITTSAMDGWTTMLYPQGAAVVGDTVFDITFEDGATKIPFVYVILNTSNVMLRQMVF